jgi:flagellar basal-body rod protein FlgG
MYLAKSIAATGLKNQQTRLDTIANNVANINSVAFKSSRLDFKDALYTMGLTPGPPRTPAPEGNQQKGHGLMIAGIAKDYRVGSIQRTDRMLDFALETEGFFSLLDADGELVYTRNGSFHLSVEDGGVFVVNGEGLYVLDTNGNRIMVTEGANSIDVDVNGTMYFKVGDTILGEANLGIFTFRNLTGLLSVGDGNYSQVPAAGERFVANGAVVRQSTLELSNVNLAEEMTRMIRAQRAFQLASRALTTADEMQGVANNMRR